MNNEMQKIVVVSPLTKQRLDKMKYNEAQKGLRVTLGGIVDRLVADECKRAEETI